MTRQWQTGDARLVERARDGDARAFEHLHARYRPAILAFCRHLTGNREDAEDAAQHTFLAAHRRIAGSGDPLELRPWLFTVARNRCLSLLRSRPAAGAIALDATHRAVDGLAAEVELREELRDLVADVARLPDVQRAALLLSQLEALDHREIGAALGVAPAKVKSLVFQARATLASTRDAREAACSDIRRQLATSTGSALRRRTLRHHVRACDGCRAFEATVQGRPRPPRLAALAGSVALARHPDGLGHVDGVQRAEDAVEAGLAQALAERAAAVEVE
ncbi:MAG: RNA polymerase sigma factor [Thermoleophilaceae bacterium]